MEPRWGSGFVHGDLGAAVSQGQGCAHTEGREGTEPLGPPQTFTDGRGRQGHLQGCRREAGGTAGDRGRKEGQQSPVLGVQQERVGGVALCPWGELRRWPLGAEAWLGSEWELGKVTVDNF